MFFKEQIRKAFINRRWRLLSFWVFIGIIATFVFVIFEDRIANWANSQIDKEWDGIVEWFLKFLSSDYFLATVLLLIGALTIIGFVILYRRAGQPATLKKSSQPLGASKRKKSGVAAQIFAKTIHDQLDFRQQVVEAIRSREPTELEDESEVSINIDKSSVLNYGHQSKAIKYGQLSQQGQAIEVAFTVNVKNPPVNIADLQMYMGAQILKRFSHDIRGA